MPNAFAYMMVLSWPIISWVLFSRQPRQVGIVLAAIGGYLLLPGIVVFDLPILPAFDKAMSIVFACLLVAFGAGKQRAVPGLTFDKPNAGILPRSRWSLICLVGVVLGAFLTSVLNSSPLIYGPTVLRGLTPYDALSATQAAVISVLPWVIARKYLHCNTSHYIVIFSIATAAAIYAMLALYEVRMSPQLNQMIYGYFPHAFAQHIRGNGFRPVVFLDHGLSLSFFLTQGYFASVVLLRISGVKDGVKFAYMAFFLCVVLVLSKSLGALFLAIVFSPILVFASVRVAIIAAATLALLFPLYPLLMGSGIIPLEYIVSLAESVDADRAGSLSFRFQNDISLIEKAMQKPLTGWGGWGRFRVYDALGNDISVTDGAWIIYFGSYGAVGYLSFFGLLFVPVILTAIGAKNCDWATAGICLMLCANLIYLIPNDNLNVLTGLVAGALAGRLERLKRGQSDGLAEVANAPVEDRSRTLFRPNLYIANESNRGPAFRPQSKRSVNEAKRVRDRNE